MLKVGIVGATGYTGAELLRILSNHNGVQVVLITSRAEQGKPVAELYPNLRQHCDLVFEAPTAEKISLLDVVFFATPHGVAQSMMTDIAKHDVVVIDLSADFRIRDQAVWEQWYQQPHGAPALIKEAVYGLPEFNRKDIRTADIIACPGCYPTSVQLGLKPLLEQGAIELDNIIVNAASGVTGAGRSAKVANLFTEVHDSFKAYGSTGHRHLPEIKQGLSDMAGEYVDLTFVPHLLPMARGIHATIYVRLTRQIDVQKVYSEAYADEPFVDVLPAGSHPETRSVKGTNTCRLAVNRAPEGNTLVVMSVIDNLCKGAAGQAIQCMNIRFGLPENEGLEAAALMP
ncbi:N-acetyl-gamma-glutamyl-phosphate reductase [Umboniibacter marinipuniceus]|uniref:N-acetyl-gamma-glutamyl-phosphate reductase n=1 Tax=Umboniibacter marinipuniceus TaxID=569599 RepID=A0A3M0AF06_9GAMM|nr:N-acetyl-gamma-glutamyl-phosphate reductase [Umboniibacter marinipuniceus]RMA82744.1 N-acetyl-gamma-glutamyl-phosphate reductase [Umboniibacter marinipuniceus]